MSTRLSIPERLQRHVTIDRATGCWLWTGSRNTRGYGHMMNAETRRPMLVHRASYAAFVGPIPDGMHVCHHCDRPLCCNPAHLFLGTRSANMRDAVAKGRHFSPARGRTHCRNGHPYTPDNTAFYPDGTRRCISCRRAQGRENSRRNKARWRDNAKRRRRKETA